MAGPAYCAAAVPVRTKMPAPMIAPMPIAVMLDRPSVFDIWCVSESPLATISSIDFRAMRPCVSMNRSPKPANEKSKIPPGLKDAIEVPSAALPPPRQVPASNPACRKLVAVLRCRRRLRLRHQQPPFDRKSLADFASRRIRLWCTTPTTDEGYDLSPNSTWRYKQRPGSFRALCAKPAPPVLSPAGFDVATIYGRRGSRGILCLC